jgi:hypothetical protein
MKHSPARNEGLILDLLKMHPMARKMEQAQRAFLTALESGDGNVAKEHLSEVSKLSDYLLEDLNLEIAKSQDALPNARGPNDIFAGGVPVRKFVQEPESVPMEGLRVPGVISNGYKGRMSRAQGTLGRWG